MTASTKPLPRSTPGLAREWPMLLLLPVLAMVVYRDLWGYDPSIGGRQAAEGAEGFFFSPTGGSPRLILALTAWLVYERATWFRRSLSASPLWPLGAVGIAVAAALVLWGHYISATDLYVPSISLLLLGGAWLLGGAPAARSMLLPAVFVLLAFPPPAVLVNRVIWPLQLQTAETTVAILGFLDWLHLPGFKSLQVADLILTEGRTFQVIETCSGLRSIETLLMSALLYAELFYRSRLQQLILIVSAPLIGLVVNEIRVMSLVLNPWSHVEVIHTTQGIAMLVVGVLLIAGLDRLLGLLLKETVPHPKVTAWRERGLPMPPLPARWRVLVIVGVLAALAVATLRIEPWPTPPKQYKGVHRIPAMLGGSDTFTNLDIDKVYMGSAGFSDRIFRGYERDGIPIDLLVGVDRRLQRRRSPYSDKTKILRSGWVVKSAEIVRMGPDGLEVELMELQSLKGRELVLHWYEGVDTLGTEVRRALLGLDRGPARREGLALVARLSTPIESNDPEARAQALRRLQAFLPEARRAAELAQEPR